MTSNSNKKDYVKIIWIVVCAAICVVSLVHFMQLQGTTNRVSEDDYLQIVQESAQSVSPDSNGQSTSVIVDEQSLNNRISDLAGLDEILANIAEMQEERTVLISAGFEEIGYDAWANAIRSLASDLRARSSDISWFVDAWFPLDSKYLDSGFKWYGYYDHFDVTGRYVPVVWVYKDTQDSILMYVTAKYDTETAQFVQGQRVTTLLGGNFLAYEDEAPGTSDTRTKEVLSSVYDILEHKGALPPGTTKEDFVNQGLEGQNGD